MQHFQERFDPRAVLPADSLVLQLQEQNRYAQSLQMRLQAGILGQVQVAELAVGADGGLGATSRLR
jgi:predicted anti-sigma-YlaC factor YlaD